MVKVLRCESHGVTCTIEDKARRVTVPPSLRPIRDCVLIHQGYRFVTLGPGQIDNCRIVEEGGGQAT